MLCCFNYTGSVLLGIALFLVSCFLSHPHLALTVLTPKVLTLTPLTQGVCWHGYKAAPGHYTS